MTLLIYYCFGKKYLLIDGTGLWVNGQCVYIPPGRQICPGLNANEIPIPYDKHHKVSSLVKSHLNTHNSFKCGVVWKFQVTLSDMKF